MYGCSKCERSVCSEPCLAAIDHSKVKPADVYFICPACHCNDEQLSEEAYKVCLKQIADKLILIF